MIKICIVLSLLILLPAAVGGGTSSILADGTGDYPTIQDAINAASEGDTLLLGDGAFTGDGNWDIECHGMPLTIRSMSGNPEACFIDCQDSHRGFYLQSGEGPDTRIAGLAVVGGRGSSGGAVWCIEVSPTFENCAFRSSSAEYHGGAVICGNGSCPLFVDCVFDGNAAADRGGALYCFGASSPSLEGCSFFANTAFRGGAVYCAYMTQPSFSDCLFEGGYASERGGGMYCYTASPTLTSCAFVENDAYEYAGGLYCIESSLPILVDCEFLRNTVDYHGAAIRFDNYSSATVERCLFSDNEAGRTGGAVVCGERSDPRFSECVFWRNTAATFDGGALYATTYSHPVLTNCTLVENGAVRNGGGVCLETFAELDVSNTIIAFDQQGCAVYCGWQASATLTCCDLYGNAGGDWVGCVSTQYGQSGNISQDPDFCGPEVGDLTLSTLSPCAPGAAGECELIGALPVGCESTPVTRTSWGAIKARFRNADVRADGDAPN